MHVYGRVPTDLLCNGQTTSDAQSARASQYCLIVGLCKRRVMTVDKHGMDFTTEQNSISKSTQSSPHIPSEIDSCVDIDPAKLFSLLERVVEETEDCGVQMMENMLEHLVF